ncbi:MAG TPA: serine/threonine-protein kinase, partial [Polyangiaceae bacterium]|nr:serine/threonine-protein kinase [Polyangiaceae bacterium]
MGGSSAGARAAELGDVLAGRYRLDRRLGEGASGVVFAAHDRTLDETVALKLVTAPSDDGTLFETVRREVKLARRVTHPNVGRIYDLGEDGGRFFLTMELVTGTSLRATLAEGTPSLGAALRITGELGAGLIAAHAAGIVHRDLKPANVILSQRDGFASRAVLTDFGIAQQVGGGGACANSAGTPAYMAPEQLLGEPIDGRTDVYALGLILFQLLVGHRPFKGDSLDVVLKRRLTEPPPDPCDLAPTLPAALGSLVAWMLATERTARPDAVMVAAALERLRGVRARELT